MLLSSRHDLRGVSRDLEGTGSYVRVVSITNSKVLNNPLFEREGTKGRHVRESSAPYYTVEAASVRGDLTHRRHRQC